MLNPKVALFYLTFLPQFVDLDTAALTVTQQLIVLGIACSFVALGLNLTLVELAAGLSRRLGRNARITTWLNRTMGAVLVGLGVRLGSERT